MEEVQVLTSGMLYVIVCVKVMVSMHFHLCFKEQVPFTAGESFHASSRDT